MEKCSLGLSNEFLVSSNFSQSLAYKIILAPCLAASKAMALPIPEEAPVMSMFF